MKIALKEFCYARSGDKGGDVNIGIAAEGAESFALLEERLTKKSVLKYFANLPVGSVERYALPNLYALNFVLRGVLGAGATSCLRVDSQGKALGQLLLEMKMEVSEDEYQLLRRRD